MIRRLMRFAVVIAMMVVGALLAVTIAYLVRGSLEAFPTAEQQDKVRRVMALLSAGLLLLECGLLLALRRIGQLRPEARSMTAARAG